MNKNNNKANQNNMVVNYNMTAEHQLKCFKLRTTAPMYAPKMKPQHYSKLHINGQRIFMLMKMTKRFHMIISYFKKIKSLRK